LNELPETPEAHKEIVEIKKEVREVRQTQDAGIYRERRDWEKLLWDTVGENRNLMRMLLVINGSKSKMEIETELNISHNMCWRLFDKLEAAGIISKLPETKNGSVIYAKLRWYNLLRLDDKIAQRLPQVNQPASTIGQEIIQTPETQEHRNEQTENPTA
jgi:hypothetical protein